jgi:hypothetical protein
MISAYPELSSYGRAMVETIAVAHKLGLSASDKYWFVWDRHLRNRTLTQAYNEKVLGGPGIAIVGGITAGAGVVLLIVGIRTAGWGRNEDPPGQWQSPTAVHVGEAMWGTGAALIAVGVPCTLWGAYRRARWLPDGTLDSASASEIRESADLGRPQSSVRWALLPLIKPHLEGVSLGTSF